MPREFLSSRKAYAMAAMIISLLILGNINAQHFKRDSNLTPADTGQDLRTLISSLPDMDVSMGYGGNGTLDFCFYSPLLLHRGGKLIYDAAAMMDAELSGIGLSEESVESLRKCVPHAWVLPKSDNPFTVTSFYYPFKPLFSDDFVGAFLSAYEKTSCSKYYGLWTCKRSPGR